MPSDLLAILKQSVRLMQEGCIGGALRYFLYSLIGQRRALRVQVGGVPLTVRTCSTDVVVALSSLKHDEIEAMREAVARLQRAEGRCARRARGVCGIRSL